MSTVLAQARLRACRYWPFASHAILSLVPVESPGLGTLAVDQFGRLYFDEEFTSQLSLDQAAGVILHELDHLLKRHHRRGKSIVDDDPTNWERWNYATDAAINQDLQSQRIPLPDGAISPATLNLPTDLSAEDYYRQLSEQAEANPQPTNNDKESPDESSNDAANQAANHEQGNATEDHGLGIASDSMSKDDQADEGEAPSNKLQSSGGSCSDGRQRPWELGKPDEDAPGLDEADQEQLIHITAKNILEKQHGTEAGGMRRWAEQILNPDLDPTTKLMSLVRRYCDLTVGIGERTYRRPSRRNQDARLVLPSNAAPLPRITVIVDTSGSMGQRELGLAFGMICKVLNAFRIRDGIQVVTGDTVGQPQQLCLSDPRAIELTGGGGTNMAAVIESVLDAKPQMVLVCTDGWTPWPTEDPGLPIVACLTGRQADLPSEYQPPEWITTLELTKEY